MVKTKQPENEEVKQPDPEVVEPLIDDRLVEETNLDEENLQALQTELEHYQTAKEELEAHVERIQLEREKLMIDKENQNKLIGQLQADLEVCENDQSHQKDLIQVLESKVNSVKVKLNDQLRHIEEDKLNENQAFKELEQKVILLESERNHLIKRVEDYKNKEELIIEQSEEIEQDFEDLKKEKKKWQTLLKELDIHEVSELKAEYKMHKTMTDKLIERLNYLEEDYSERKELSELGKKWLTEKHAMEEELDLVRKDLEFYRESEIQWESITRLQSDYRHQQDLLTTLRKEVESIQQERLELMEENKRLIRDQEEFEKAKNISEFYRLRSRNLEEEIKRLRKIEEDSAADETKIFENFTKILENSSKTEAQVEAYPGEDAIAARVRTMAKKANFHFADDVIHGFLAAIRSSRFLILKGLSGTGKTSLPRIVAHALGGVCETIAVQPSWKSKTDLIGFYNHFNSRFLATPFTEALFKAQLPENRNRFYLIMLDEMNLARVEYYFSDFNSKLELEREKQVIELFDSPGKTSGDLSDYILEGNKLKIPPNVFFIGTINEDESTYSLSDKIYDRAQVLDFQEVTDHSVGDMEKVEPAVPVDFFSYQHKMETINEVDVHEAMTQLEEIFTILKEKFLIHLGHRPRRHMRAFLQTYKETKKWDMKEGVDLQIISKILPKIRFSFDERFEENVDYLMDWIARRLKKDAGSLQALDRIRRGL